MKGGGPMGWLAGCLQALGAVGLAVGLFLVLSPGLALAVVSCLAVAGGTALEVGRRPRQVPAPIATDPRASLLDDYRRTASER
jgi:hypothetical protein